MKKISERNLRCYDEQYWYGKAFLNDFLNISEEKNYSILEIGPAEGGLLKFFTEKGHKCFGLELSNNRFDNSIQLNSELGIKFINGDITNLSEEMKSYFGQMDILICRDVIEHIPLELKQTAMENMRAFLKKDGLLFVSFPPKYSAYAGHQQVAPNRFAKLPFLHFLPNKVYASFLKLLNIKQNIINSLLEIKQSRISIAGFEKLLNKVDFNIIKKSFYLIRPCYESRFNLKRIKHNFNSFALREILTLGAIYLLKK